MPAPRPPSGASGPTPPSAPSRRCSVPMPHGSAEPRRVSVVTGAAGFLGSHLCRLIAARGDELRVLVRPGDYLSTLDGLRLTAVHGDVRSAEDLDRLSAGLSPPPARLIRPPRPVPPALPPTRGSPSTTWP